MPDPSAPRVFLSYARSDGLDFARTLQALLEKEGLPLYRDLSNLVGDEGWWLQVERAIKDVEHIVLVLTPAALASIYVRDEWRLARQEGKAVWLVNGAQNLDLSGLPWLQQFNRHNIDLPDSLGRLILGLKAPAPPIRRAPFMADQLSAGFIKRPEKSEEIKRRLLDAKGEPVAITAALRGAGGFGKTALANALCHDLDIREAFDGGILRVTLGEAPGDPIPRIADLIYALTGQKPGFSHLDSAKSALADTLGKRRCLLVIDDVWSARDLDPFLHRGPEDRTTRLITTRYDRVLPMGAARVAVDAMTSGQALDMLVRGLPPDTLPTFRPRLAALAAKLGEWPLLLGLANGVLQARIARGSKSADALTYAEAALAQRGIDSFSARDAAARRDTASGTLEVSLEQLKSDERVRFAELSVFVEDAEIPIAAAIGLWHQAAGLSKLDGEDLVVYLDELSLLIDLDLGRGSFRLHDVFRTLMRTGPAKDRLAELDGTLMAHFRTTCPAGDLTRLKDRYGLRHAITHLRGAGEGDAADLLLLDPAWMQAKLSVLGIQPLLADYAGHADQTAPFAVGAVLTLAANALARRERELPSQLLARLAPGDAPGLDSCLDKAKACLSFPALVPLRPTFTPPGAELRRFEGHTGPVNAVAAVPGSLRALSAADDWSVRLWNVETGAELRRFKGHTGRINSIAILPDGQSALSASDDRTLRLWDIETGNELRRFDGHALAVNCVAVLPNGQHALSGSDDNSLRLWDIETGAELRRFTGHMHFVSSVAVFDDGRRALSGSYDGTIRLWNIETGNELHTVKAWMDRVKCVAVLPDGGRALSGSNDATVRLWDIATGAELRRFEGHQNAVESVVALADGKRALSASADGTMRLWDIDTGSELHCFEGHEQTVLSIAVLDERRAITGSVDESLRLWNIEAGTELRRPKGHDDRITSLAVMPDGRGVLSASYDDTLRLWQIETGDELRRFEGHEDAVFAVAILPGGRRAVSSAEDWTMRIWDIETGHERGRFGGQPDVDGIPIATDIAALADGKCALAAATDWTLRSWNLETGTGLCRFDGHTDAVNAVAALPDGQRALSASADRTLRLWNIDSGDELRRFDGHSDRVNCVAVLSDGRALSGSDDTTLRLWDMDVDYELRHFDGHEGEVNSIAVLPDGRQALSGSEDRTLRLWNVETGAELACLTFDSALTAVAWSQGLRVVVVGDAVGRLHVIQILCEPAKPAPVLG